MQIRITDLPAEGVVLEDHLETSHLPELAALAGQGGCRFMAPVEVRLFITPVAGMFRVEGKLRTRVGLVCSRCLKAFDDALTSHFHVTYTRESPGGETLSGEERELDSEDMGLAPFTGEEIDFRDTIQEQAILAIPMQPKCHEACKGLCARCGADLNEAACTCPPEAGDPRLAVLKNLKLDPQ